MAGTVGWQIARSLEMQGVDRIFCVPGESYLGLTDALTDVPSIQLVVCRHEGSAGYMAIADGLLTGRPGVALVSRGPGLSNAMVSLHSAMHDANPLVMLVGHVERKDIGRMALQEQNYSRLLCDITKSVIEVTQASQASEAIARAFVLACSGTPGPVAVVLPEDLLDESCEGPLCAPRPVARSGPLRSDMQELAARLKEAQRPMIWVGGAFSDREGLADLAKLALAWGIAVCSTNKRPHLFDADHPCFAGHVGIRSPAKLLDLLKQSDLLIALGERLTDTLSQSYTFPSAPDPQMPLVHIWPDPDEIGRTWRPVLGMACDPGAVVAELLREEGFVPSPERLDWIRQLNETQAELRAPKWEATEDGVNFAAAICEIGKHLSRAAAIAVDAGSFATFLYRYIGFHTSQQVLTSVVGAMGAGIPMAVAAALRDPGRQVVAFVGDGGVLMTGNELATARLHGVNPIIVISDNGNYGTIGLHQDVRYPGRPFESATQLWNPEFGQWAESFGALGILVETEEQLSEAVARAFAPSDRPVVLCIRSSASQMSAWRKASRPLNFTVRR